ncbi:MT-A70-domain-containing protein [Scheffersomyces amazonensis]|uniref:MT-A70-domain-containing protein n=1 Tax=Scheffersomyces amazonensis TaxID=1078765 RepID=UPI00315CB527
MMIDKALDKFIPFIEFLLDKRDELLVDPIRGELYCLMYVFKLYCMSNGYEVNNLEQDIFTYYIEEFNLISGQALKWDPIVEGNMNINSIIDMPKLNWINLAAIIILKHRLNNNNIGESIDSFEECHSPLKLINNNDSCHNQLLDLLDNPLFSKITVKISSDSIINSSFHCSYDDLDKLLRNQTARTKLSKEKIRLKVLEKPFYEVCNDSSHNQMLTSFCFSKKDYGNQSLTKQTYPDPSILHQKLYQYKNLMPQDIYNCSQTKVHYLAIVNNHTDHYLGDCSYLDTCHKMKTCRYLHYYTLIPSSNDSFDKENQLQLCKAHDYTIGECFTEYNRDIVPPQWINCDVRYLPFQILGKFAAIISDPAWDIHMSLPYGTCKDDELLALPMHELQDEGIILLWVTGRSIEIGRRALQKWGYHISDEMIWVKLNQLRRTIVTGRTGHWLNHSKEHLLVGIKGNPIWLNRKMDFDVVVSSTRETSRKPDEIYDIVERMVGIHSRKLEIFGRDHNTRPGWLTIGNQLQGTNIVEQEVKTKYESYIKNRK